MLNFTTRNHNILYLIEKYISFRLTFLQLRPHQLRKQWLWEADQINHEKCLKMTKCKERQPNKQDSRVPLLKPQASSLKYCSVLFWTQSCCYCQPHFVKFILLLQWSDKKKRRNNIFSQMYFKIKAVVVRPYFLHSSLLK